MKPAADIIRPQERLSMWNWNVENVDFSLDQDYRAASAGRYDPTLMPWWKFIVDSIDDLTIREVVVLGVSQGGKEEHCLCFPARYWAGTNKRLHCLYVGHQEEKAEEIYLDRVIGGMRLTHPTRNLTGSAKMRGMIYNIGATRFGCTHGGTGGGLKGKPWDAVLCSEVSSFKSVAVIDEARKRGMTRPFFKLVIWGCPDWRQRRPSDEDPLFIEHDNTSKHEWIMPDPATGNLFRWEVGDGEGAGIYWDKSAKREDGSYDLDIVRKTAHYITPDGTVIRQEDRWKVMLSGSWQPTNLKAPSWKIGVHFHQLMMPWEEVGGFGHIAVRKLESVHRGPDSYRAFRYEVEAEKWYGEKQTIEVASVDQRRGSYRHGQRLLGLPAYEFITQRRGVVIITVDVQKDCLFVVAREWFDGGESALVEFAEVQGFREVAAIKAKHNASWVFIDLGYTDRRNECLEQCVYGEIKGAVPMFGRDSIKTIYDPPRQRDPFEGTAKQGKAKIVMVTFNPNMAKNILSQLTNGQDPHQWLLPSDIPPEYIRQVTAEECVDGAWVKRHKDNHAWDCENMSLVAAMVLGIFRQVGIDLDIPVPEIAPVRANNTRRVGVYMPD